MGKTRLVDPVAGVKAVQKIAEGAEHMKKATELKEREWGIYSEILKGDLTAEEIDEKAGEAFEAAKACGAERKEGVGDLLKGTGKTIEAIYSPGQKPKKLEFPINKE